MSVVEQNSHHLAGEGLEIEAAIPASLLDLLSSGNDSLDLESPSAKAYLDRLVSLGLDDLVQEPSIISNERSGVDLELVNLCYREYSTFTSVHQCSAAIGAAFDDFDTSLDKLIESIPALEDECRQFGRGTAEIQSARKRAVLLQEHEDKLLDVLEIPQLMETCVRNGYYQEALELSSHVSNLREKHHAIIVDDVADEANGILQLMTAQLLGVLREPVKLPALIKAVGYLRKLQDLDDIQLGLAFLSSRLHNYRARLVEIEKDRAEPVRYLRRYIDLFREHVFDIISQYTTIFSGVTGDQLATFVNLCVDDLVQLVHRYIPRIASDSAAMSSILVQLGYCSLSFARAGLDFSSLLVDPFKASIKHSYDQAAESAATLVKTTLSLDPQPAAPTSLVSAYHLQQILTDPHSPPNIRQDADNHTPPAVLAHFPPIAQYLNAHLTALNSLRLLAPFQSLPALQASQNRSIQQSTAAVLDYVEQAVAIEMTGELSRSSGSRHRHTRTNSTPRAHLIRRNTETQLSAETLAAKRRETKRICVAFADAWVLTCEFIRQAMGIVLETDAAARDVDGEVLTQLEEWIEGNREKDLDAQEQDHTPKVNGNQQMNPLEEGSEAVDGVDMEVGKAMDLGQSVDPARVASPKPVPVELAPPTATTEPVPDRQSPPMPERMATIESSEPPIETAIEPSAEPSIKPPIEPPVEPPIETPVEVTAPTPEVEADHEASQGVDLPPIPAEIATEQVASGYTAEPSPTPDADSTPLDVKTSAPTIEHPVPSEAESVNVEPAPVAEKAAPTDVESEAVVPERLSTPAIETESIAAVETPIQAETQPSNVSPHNSPAVDAQSDATAPVESEPGPVQSENRSDNIPPSKSEQPESVPVTANDSSPATPEPAKSNPVELEPSPLDTPDAPSVPVSESATPLEAEEGDEPGTGTVTPTAEPHGQEASAPKTNKKKKKKNGKK
jgi:hypothetical protein